MLAVAVPNIGLTNGYKIIWKYNSHNTTIRFAQDIKQKSYNTPFKWVSIPDCFQVVNTVAPITSPSGPDNGGGGETLALAAASFLKIYNRVGRILRGFKKKQHTWINTSDDCPPLIAHFPSMIITGTPVIPFLRASSHIASTSFCSSLDSRNAVACLYFEKGANRYQMMGLTFSLDIVPESSAISARTAISAISWPSSICAL